MIGWFNSKPVRKLLNIPKNKKVALIISIGYAPEDYKLREKIRKPLDSVVSYNKY